MYSVNERGKGQMGKKELTITIPTISPCIYSVLNAIGVPRFRSTHGQVPMVLAGRLVYTPYNNPLTVYTCTLLEAVCLPGHASFSSLHLFYYGVFITRIPTSGACIVKVLNGLFDNNNYY